MNKLFNLIVLSNSINGDDPEILNNFEEFFTSVILRWLLWGVTMLFTVLVIQAGVKMGMAKSPEEKQANKSKLISLFVGFGICLVASTIVTALAGVFGTLNE